MLALLVPLLWFSSVGCNSIDEDFSHSQRRPDHPDYDFDYSLKAFLMPLPHSDMPQIIRKRPSIDPEPPSTKTAYEQEFERFTQMISQYNFTKDDLKTIFGAETAPPGDQFLGLIANQVVEIIGLNEIRRVFGLKQQPMACDRLIDEKPIDKTIKIDKKAMRLFQLSVLLCSQANRIWMWSPRLECQIKVTGKQFTAANYVYKKFPEIRKLFDMRLAELNMERLKFDTRSVDKAFVNLYAATRAADLVLKRGIEQLTGPSKAAYEKRYKELGILYTKAVEEKQELIGSDHESVPHPYSRPLGARMFRVTGGKSNDVDPLDIIGEV